jgi:hypothetical protein
LLFGVPPCFRFRLCGQLRLFFGAPPCFCFSLCG